MPYVLEFEINGLPKLPNALLRGRWMSKYAHFKIWKNYVHACCLGKKPEKPLETAKLTFIRFSFTEPDSDGLVGSFKPIQDALVEAEIIVNDRRKNIGMPSYDWKFAPRKQGKIFVRVEEVEASEL